jgi:hypothetical protein
LKVNVDLLKDGSDLLYSLMVSFSPRNAHTQHQRIRGLLLLWTLQKLGASASQAKSRACLGCDGLHMCSGWTKQTTSDAKAGLLLDANQELTLKLLL